MTEGNWNGIVALAAVGAGLVLRMVFVLLRPGGHPIDSLASMGDAVFALGAVGLLVLVVGSVISIFALAAAKPTGRWMGILGMAAAAASLGLAFLGIL